MASAHRKLEALVGCFSTVLLATLFCAAVTRLVFAQAPGRVVVGSPAQQVVPSQTELDILETLPHYHPGQIVSGTIRLWGHGAPVLDFMGVLVKAWEDGFHKYQPGVRFEYDMYGTASAMGALYSGAGDIAILGQEIYPFERSAFIRAKHYPPTIIEIATGSVDVRNFDFAIGVFVNKANPLAKLTVDQFSQIFAEQEPDGPDNIVRWGQLGLAGEWASRPIRLYGWRSDDVFSTFLQNAALHGNHKWRCCMKEYTHIHRPDGTIYDSGQQILDDLSKDPAGIAVSNLRYVKDNAVKPLALGRSPGGPFYDATKQTLIARQYPFVRIIPAVIDRQPGHPVDPAVKEFLLYILSKEGQGDIVRHGKYLPMSPITAARERRKLQ